MELRFLSLGFLLFLYSFSYAQERVPESPTSSASPQSPESEASSPPATGPSIVFDDDVFDFGTLTQGDKAEKIFRFVNEGVQPLILFNVKTTCGCTAPNWTQKPVLPGETGEVTIVFNSSGKSGTITRRLLVASNAENKPSYPLTVKGFVKTN